jgi:8-oxo-dGTP pyrophosphatase MutT (NUDIX family)
VRNVDAQSIREQSFWPNTQPGDSGRPELKIQSEVPSISHPTDLVQVGALPLRFEGGAPQVMLVTSRETKRWVIPKGWPMRGKKNWAAAAQEAKEEAGVVGKPHKQSIGEFYYFKRREAHFDLCRVEVYLIGFKVQLESYREKGQRDLRWFPIDDAVNTVQEPGLSSLLREFDFTTFRKRKTEAQSGSKKSKRGAST